MMELHISPQIKSTIVKIQAPAVISVDFQRGNSQIWGVTYQKMSGHQNSKCLKNITKEVNRDTLSDWKFSRKIAMISENCHQLEGTTRGTDELKLTSCGAQEQDTDVDEFVQCYTR
ncbi:hypothetical protein AKO1_006832 [Acrasis kona]|uniref:Uncharacterized protein n=1 Tax=Acrasis kona TaxID=1008807 RepID=A0AAW2YT06_9EUKA